MFYGSAVRLQTDISFIYTVQTQISKTSILFQLLTQKTLEEDSIENSISASTITVSVCKIFFYFHIVYILGNIVKKCICKFITKLRLVMKKIRILSRTVHRVKIRRNFKHQLAHYRSLTFSLAYILPPLIVLYCH